MPLPITLDEYADNYAHALEDLSYRRQDLIEVEAALYRQLADGNMSMTAMERYVKTETVEQRKVVIELEAQVDAARQYLEVAKLKSQLEVYKWREVRTGG